MIKLQKKVEALHEELCKRNLPHMFLVQFNPANLLVAGTGSASWMGQTLQDVAADIEQKIITKSPDLVRVEKENNHAKRL